VNSGFQQLSRGNRLGEDDLSLYFNLNAFSKSATLLRELAAVNSLTQLRGGVQSLLRQAIEIENLFERSRGFASQFVEWRAVQSQLSMLANASNLAYAPLGEISSQPPPPPGIPVTGGRDRNQPIESGGRFWWRGVVDGADRIRLTGDQVSIEHIEAQQVRDDSYDLSNPLPRRAVTVTLRKIRGRGRIDIVEQPSPANRYSVAVLLEDKKGGTDTYEFELLWNSTEPSTPRIPRR
jgi:hypothetical protein